MPARETASLELRAAGGLPRGELVVSVLPGLGGRGSAGGAPAPLLDLRSDPDRDPAVEPVQLLEGGEYRFELRLAGPGAPVTTDKPELFSPDEPGGRTGRIRPGLRTGTVVVRFLAGGAELGRAAFEVRSRKLDYSRHYRWMLRDIAAAMAELAMERFAPAEGRFVPDPPRDAPTLYQRLAFLASLLRDAGLGAAVRRVVARPYVAWVEDDEPRSPALGLRPGSAVARRLVGPGPRVPWRPAGGAGLGSLPERVRAPRAEPTVDNVPNRFVKLALTRSREVVSRIADALRREAPTPARERGLSEAAAVLEELDALLAAGLFREVGRLARIPTDNQVLQKREGYREVLRAYAQLDVAARLTWQGGEDVYGAGQRDVAALYEYWAFVQLGRIVARLCGGGLDWSPVLRAHDGGLSVELRRGRETVVAGATTRLGRRLRVGLCFNRTFGALTDGEGSWTRAMRPDASLRIGPAPGEAAPFDPIWIHFDAKYRLDRLDEILGPASGADGERTGALTPEAMGRARHDDLTKMHAYRDAIRGSAGAYVLFPGTEGEVRRAYHELLPGVGAFALLPGEGGEPSGGAPLVRFLDDVLEHSASQLTQHERGRYWSRRIYEGTPSGAREVAAAPFLRTPPADTRVLLGAVRSAAHLEWIRATARYDLRADGRPGTIRPDALVCELLALYGEPLAQSVELWRIAAGPELVSGDRLREAGHPAPSGQSCHCLTLRPLAGDAARFGVTRARVDDLLRERGAAHAPGSPEVASWLDLVG